MNAMTPIIATSATLSTRALLVSLTISQWSGRRLDRAVTEELNQQKGASSDASRVNKLLVPPSALAGIQAVVSETRQGFYDRTLPWSNDGARIVAAAGYLPLAAWIRSQIAKFDGEVAKLVNDYDQHVADAQKRMGGLFRASDYPLTNEIQQKFAVEIAVTPVPVSSDFRVELESHQVDRIRAEIEQNVSRATENAISDVYRRVATLTERMVDRLHSYTPGDRTGNFRSSLVENIRDLIEVMPSLNIVGSPELDALGNRLRALTLHDAAALKEDDTLRREVAAEAQRILDSVGDYLA